MRLTSLLLLTAVLCACGQTGPLVLPDRPQQAAVAGDDTPEKPDRRRDDRTERDPD